MPPKDVPIGKQHGSTSVAPTPQNTPLNKAPIAQQAPVIPDTIDEDQDDFDATGVSGALAKFAQLGLDDGAEVEHLPLAVRRRIEGLKGVHLEYTKIEKEYKREVLELDRKYAALYKPVFERRNAIITGAAEPTAQEITLGEEQTLKDDPDAEPLASQNEEEDADVDVKGVPEFWLTALRNHPEIGMLISERDSEALNSLTDIQLEYLPPSSPGYKLTFRFGPNAFFTNEVLTKTYNYQDEIDYSGDYVYSSAEGCTIDWKEDMDLTKTFEVRKQRNKTTNRTRMIKKAISTPSFFDFFSPPSPPLDPESAQLTDEQLEELEDRLELDYQVGEDIKEKIVPRAIDYYTGRAVDFDLDDEDDDDDDGEDGWDDDSDQSDNDVPPVKSRRQVTKGTAKTDPGECKNQ